MSNPWEDIDKAFSPMCVDQICYKGTRGQTAFQDSLKVCTFINEYNFDDGIALESDERMMTVFVQTGTEEGWNRDEKPAIGDIITMADNSKFKVTNVKHDNSTYVIQAREC